jgi:SMODS and SLOG-associating 2TM effector domain 1
MPEAPETQPADLPESATTTAPELRVDALDLDKEGHKPTDTDLLYRIYLDKRIQSQMGFYQSRVRENERNADFTFMLGGLVMTVSSLVATISAAGTRPELALLSAILPAFAALLASFRQLYGWERQSNIYRDSLLGLERVRLIAPDNDRVRVADLRQIFPQLVTSSESVFHGEVSQWGQFVSEKDKPGAEQDAGNKSLRSLASDLNLSDEQLAAIASIMAAGKREGNGETIVSTPVLAANTVAGTALPAPAKPNIPTNPLPPDEDGPAAG